MSGIDKTPEQEAQEMSARELRNTIRQLERAAVPGAQVPPVIVEQPALSASMDAAGNVHLEATTTPQDRAFLHRLAQEQAREAADRLRSPAALGSLFPSNRPERRRFVPRRLPHPLVTKEN